MSSTIELLLRRTFRGRTKVRTSPQQGLLQPIGVRDKIVPRLMRALNPAGLDVGCNRLAPLALAGKDKPFAVGAERRPPIRVPQVDAKCSK